MPNQIVLAFTVDTVGTSYGPAEAATALSDVPLYQTTGGGNDPVLGQFFGLTIGSDATSTSGSKATRTIRLNMTASGAGVPPYAPPLFPCNPITTTPPDITVSIGGYPAGYPLLQAETLPGSFLTTPGSAIVGTSENQLPSLVGGDTVQFMAQPGVFYEVLTVTTNSITLTSNYTGPFAEDEGAAVMNEAPVGAIGATVPPAPPTIAAIYSSSLLDTNGVTLESPIPAGPGARTVTFTYYDSTGAGPFLTNPIALMGTYPAPVTLNGGIDIAVIAELHILLTGGFGNSVGQITLCELAQAPTPIPVDATYAEYLALVDAVQLTIARPLFYLPPSYFALAQPQASAPQLTGDFFVTPGSINVPTSASQVDILFPGNTIQFAAYPAANTPLGTEPFIYTIAAVSPQQITLTEPYESEVTTKVQGVLTTPVASGAWIVSPSPATPPTDTQLAGPLGEYVNPGTAIPPPNPPLPPATMTPAPTGTAPPPAGTIPILSGMFARTLQLALAVPVVESAITFA